MTRAERARMFRNRAYNLRFKYHRANYSAWETNRLLKQRIAWRRYECRWSR